MESYKPHTKCRACGSTNLFKYLDLGPIPLSNNLNDTKEESTAAERFPLEIMFCEECNLSQLSVVVDPEKLFSYYVYRSSVNGGYIKHCREMAKTLQKEYGLDKDSFHIDIASNDGTLLKEFKEEIGLQVLGIDPAKNLAKIAQEGGIPTIDDFWNESIANRIIELYGKKADLITATNVFAHVDDIKGFLEACKIILKHNGILIIECPYFPQQFKSLDFTQTYFEHLSYISLTPIAFLCRRIDLQVVDVNFFNIHGGTIRFTISHKNSLLSPTENVGENLDNEYDRGFSERILYQKWAERIDVFKEDLYYSIIGLTIDDSKVCAFSASAKGNILLNSSGLSNYQIDYIVDETPEKQGKFSPGTGIPIVGMDTLLSDPPDYLLLLSYNFKDEIMEKVKKAGYKGKFIIPIPTFQIIS